MSTLTLWKISKSIHEEIYFKTKLQTGTSSTIETIEKYKKNLKSQRRMALLSNLAIVYVIGVVSLVPLFTLLHFLSIEKDLSNINQLLFTNSLVFGIYNLYIFFILFMGGVMTYTIFMRGEYFKLLYPLTLSPSQLTQITFFVFVRMNMIQVMFILLALPISSLFLSQNLLVFLIIFLNNLINLFFIIFVLIILSWFLTHYVFNNSKKTQWGSLLTIITMIIYIFTIIPIFLLMSQFLDIIVEIFTLSYESGITTETNILLSLFPFPMASGYITSIILSNNLTIVPLSIITSSLIAFGLFICIISTVVLKGLTLIKKLYTEKLVQDKTQKELVEIKLLKKTSHPTVKTLKTNLIFVFRDYTSLSLFVLALIFPLLLVMMSFVFPQKYIGIGGVSGFLTTMLSMLSGMIALLLFAGTKISERNLGPIYCSLPLKEQTLFRSKQIIVTGGLISSLLFGFLLSNMINAPIPLLTCIKLLLVYPIVGTVLILVNTLLFGSFNHRYTLTVENNDRAILKLAVIFITMFLTIRSYDTLIHYIVTALDTIPETLVALIVAGTIFLVLEVISWKIFRVQKTQKVTIPQLLS
jgi:hypothetical protein